jgi:hypothetical protein
MEKEAKASHDVLFIVMSVLATVMLAVTLFINGISGSLGIEMGWFLNSTGDISDYYFLEITPAGWTFSIWGFIYAFQVAFIIYLLVSLCRRRQDGSPAYRRPPVLNSAMLALYVLNLCLNSSWLFLWDRRLMPVALVVIALLPFTLFLALAIHHNLVFKSGRLLTEQHRLDLVTMRIIIQNGLALYATWVTIATLLNFAIVLTYWGDVDQPVASTASLSILLVEVLVYSLLENVVWDRYLRYTYSPWMVVAYALAGSMSQNWTPGTRNSTFTAVLMALALALACLKVALSVWRGVKRPLYAGNKVVSQSKQELALA